jgi:phage protein D/phage baseplate assembly protein gpV
MAAQRSSNLFEIKVEGKPLGADIAASLLEASIEDEMNLPDTVELVFRDPMRTVLAGGGFDVGKKLSISVVSEAAAAGLTIVRGYDPSHRLQRGTTTETHLDVTYGDIAAKIAGRHGLEKGDGGRSSVVHEAVVQWNMTDWEFLRMLATETGDEVVVVDGRLHLREPSDSSSGPDKGDLGSENARQLVAGGNLLRLRATVSGAEQVEEVQVRGWDYKTKEPVEATARAGEQSLSAAAGSGAADLASKLGGGALVKLDLPVDSDEVAREAAESLVEQLGSAATELDGVVFGNAELRAGVTVSVANVGAPFDGQYALTSCRHTYDSTNGYLTGFRVSGRQNRTMLGLVTGNHRGDRSSINGVVPALVSNLDDPDKLGRVKVTFPWIADTAESPWARVAMAGAGHERGIVWLPEVGDEVLVAFDHGDPRRPYVVGGLHNGKDQLPVSPVDNGTIVTRAMVSRNGHRLELHDGDDAVTIATGDGNHRIVLDQQGGKILIETTGDVEVASKAKLSVKAPSGMTFESTGAFELKANGVTIDAGTGAFNAKGVQSKVEGSGSVEVSSSGQTTVRGSIVKIN